MFIKRNICLYFCSNSNLYVFSKESSKVDVFDGILRDGCEYSFVESLLYSGYKYNFDKNLEQKFLNTLSVVILHIFKTHMINAEDTIYVVFPDWFGCIDIYHFIEPLLNKSKIIIFPETLFLIENPGTKSYWEKLEINCDIAGITEEKINTLNSSLIQNDNIEFNQKDMIHKFSSFLNDHTPYQYFVENRAEYLININDNLYNINNQIKFSINYSGIKKFELYEIILNCPLIRCLYKFDINHFSMDNFISTIRQKYQIETLNNSLDINLKYDLNKAEFKLSYDTVNFFNKTFKLRDKIYFGTKIYN